MILSKRKKRSYCDLISWHLHKQSILFTVSHYYMYVPSCTFLTASIAGGLKNCIYALEKMITKIQQHIMICLPNLSLVQFLKICDSWAILLWQKKSSLRFNINKYQFFYLLKQNCVSFFLSVYLLSKWFEKIWNPWSLKSISWLVLRRILGM